MQRHVLFPVFVFSTTFLTAVSAEDWPAWRFDAGRSSASPERLTDDLQLRWTRLMPRLKPAWPEDPRLHFDAAYEPVVAGETLFTGSSRNDSVTAVDLKTGQQRWRFFADGPVRFAPLVYQGKVYFGADDGALYCLDAGTGLQQWRFTAAPTARKVIGSERVISVWPVRGGPVLVDGRIHFTVGVWPFEGTFLYSLDPATGRVVDTQAGGPGGTVVEHDVVTLSDLTPQGYLTATDSTLYIPQGRSTVATLDRKTQKFGTLRYSTHGVTNYHVAASGPWLFHGAVTFNTSQKKQISATTRTPVIGDGVLYAADGTDVTAFDLRQVKIVERTDRRGKKTKASVLGKLWSFPFHELKGISEAEAAQQLKEQPLVVDLLAGERLYGHQADLVFALDVTRPQQPAVVWQTTLGSHVSSMIAANGHLVVTTGNGQMFCFGEGAVELREHRYDEPRMPAENAAWSGRVTRMLEKNKAGDAYCVALGIGSGGLISELLRQSKLRIVVVEPDVGRVAQLRDHYQRMGIYGTRIVAHAGQWLNQELPPYLANLVVSETPGESGLTSNPQAVRELFRILRPYGGTAWLAGDSIQHGKVAAITAGLQLAQAELTHGSDHSLLTRTGALPGSADWTHEYGDASNTLMSRDSLVKAPLGVLWFGGPAADGSLFYNRHFWGPSMAVIGGRMFLQGPGKMTAVDVYTGRILWQLPLSGTAKYLP
ncbi:MAG: PQQ-binding-like beta-propeller repeat protein, partial [Planctomycetaceae bacterium]